MLLAVVFFDCENGFFVLSAEVLSDFIFGGVPVVELSAGVCQAALPFGDACAHAGKALLVGIRQLLGSGGGFVGGDSVVTYQCHVAACVDGGFDPIACITSDVSRLHGEVV